MAKSTTEQLRDAVNSLLTLGEREVSLRREVERLTTHAEKTRDDIANLRQENAVLRQRVEDHLKRVEEWDRRRWGLIILLIGTVLSLASGLIVTLSRGKWTQQ